MVVVVSLIKLKDSVGIQLDISIFSIMINCYCHLGRADMEGFVVFGQFFKRGFQPDVVVFTTLLKGLFLQREKVQAVKLFEKMVEYQYLSEEKDEQRGVFWVFLTKG
ncbi:hypothetical protein AQUCO_00600258v1 [Aquilegia coerulea]|uniref:Pentatricopeptide repeat-containing protein n=1 Tax=Aquilegia coerulea TaxID=218851 RepID=A0A2G5ENP9_AQUCA|nr:hypothetical protein AQUCO_00600258v1 [Aquilegia coerulea]